jgi:fructose-bisphosphate aldolase, class II
VLTLIQQLISGEGRKKRLDIQRIAQIKIAAQVPLTLHGGSGTGRWDQYHPHQH